MALQDKGILEALLYTAGDEGLDQQQLLVAGHKRDGGLPVRYRWSPPRQVSRARQPACIHYHSQQVN